MTWGRRAVRLLMLGGLALTAGCATKFPPEQQLLPGESVLVSPRIRWNPTGIDIEKGKSYTIAVRAIPDNHGRSYADSWIPATPDGIHGWGACLLDHMAREPKCRLNPASWRSESVKRLRVLHDGKRRATFLTVIGAIGMIDESQVSERAFVIGSAMRLDAEESGELYVFANDWYGDGDLSMSSRAYANNKGLLILQVREADQTEAPQPETDQTTERSPSDR